MRTNTTVVSPQSVQITLSHTVTDAAEIGSAPR
jgi:hypothetical protein